MKRSRLWTGLLGAIVALGCAFSAKEAKGGPADRQPVYIDDVSAPASAAAGTDVTVTVSGNLPTPAWEITDVEVKKDAGHVTITIWGVLKDDRPGIQVLQPFSRAVPVEGLEPGNWTIEVVGHGGTGDKVQVHVH